MIFEEGRQPSASDITALVDGGRQYGPPFSPIPHGIVRTAAKKRDAKGSASDYHCSIPRTYPFQMGVPGDSKQDS